jgi:hypothetical protein
MLQNLFNEILSEVSVQKVIHFLRTDPDMQQKRYKTKGLLEDLTRLKMMIGQFTRIEDMRETLAPNIISLLDKIRKQVIDMSFEPVHTAKKTFVAGVDLSTVN